MIGKWKRDWGLTGRVFLTWMLILAVYLFFIGAINYFFPGRFYFLVGLAFLFAFGQYFLSDRLVLASTRARIVAEDEEPELHAMIEKLCREADLPKPRIAVMASPVPNAFATGRSPNHAVVAVTDSIMKTLNREELEAVIAHELSHVKNRDILTMTVASFIAMIASMVMQNAFFMNLFDSRDNNGAWIAIWVVSIFVWIVATLLMLLLSRYREFAADRGSAMITGNPRALISALNKISGKMEYVPAKKKQEIEGANAFFIIPAISGKSLTELLATHPSLDRRVAALEKIEAELRGY
ncbi:zinc metalloprotease HtpX [Methanoplanus sp. FWC-SCC4]|uniref:Protease HtpX homolog n=1 Tax=Methanochimaera problematica TaxID=2609417 RepID=A0AA97I3U6_9EURY|nr:zinc metalloprotease HtpX [Methanoplanus sp. FWC-SCC4]WOF17068.1 zinc metalloprotease HtpX [Methanoplanus sp. FWC-SCC4]